MAGVGGDPNGGGEWGAGVGSADVAEFAAVLDAVIVGVVEEGDAGAVLAGAADRQRRSVIGVVVGVGSGGVGAEAVVCGIEIEGGWRGGRGGVDGDVERGRAGAGIARNIGLDGADVMDAVAAERNVGAEDAAGDGGAAEAEFAAVLDAVIVGVVEEGDAGAVLAGAADRQRRSVIGEIGRASCRERG